MKMLKRLIEYKITQYLYLKNYLIQANQIYADPKMNQ